MGELTRESFIASADQELDRLDSNIGLLETNAKKMSGDAKNRIDGEIKALKIKYDTLKKDVDDAKTKTDSEFSELRKRFDSSLRDLQREYNDLAAKVG